ncbi:MAG TPA: cyclase [Blastocatellia bacterium]|nr:cyclase [Blastocatellia bacterium]
MNETPLTQEVIDGANVESGENEGLFAKAAKHPFIAGGAILAGAGLAYAAVKTIQNAADTIAREVHIETSIAIDKSPEELYAFWRDFENLPLFMKNLESVIELDERKSHWMAKGVGAARVEWDAEIYNETENELIAWRSLENADVVNAGSVRFQKAPTGHGTYVRVTVNYNPPAGKLGATVAQLLGGEPTQLIKEDLRRLKQMMEVGEISTIDGQTSGRAESEDAEIPTISQEIEK